MTKREKQLEAKAERLQAELTAALEKIKILELKLDILIKRIFDPKSEKISPDQLELLLNGEEEPGKPQTSSEQEDSLKESIPEEVNPKKKKKSKPKAPRLPDHLKVVISDVIRPAEVEANPELYKKIGEDVQDLLSYTPAEYYKSRRINEKYVRKDEPSHAPLQGTMPAAPIPGTLANASMGAHLITSKYCDHIPQYRLSSILLTRHQLPLGRALLNRWCLQTLKHLEPIYTSIHIDLLSSNYLQCDETAIKYLKPGNGKVKEGRLWVMNQPTGGVFYHWNNSRSAKVLEDLLQSPSGGSTLSFSGVLQSDAYAAYESYAKDREDIFLCACLAHIRRYFVDAETVHKRLKGWILRQISHLYQIESGLRAQRAGPSLRAAVRSHQSAPIFHRLEQLWTLKKDAFLPSDPLSKAIRYASKNWSKQKVWLGDGHVEIDNNLDENAVRPTKLGMKNWLFFGSEDAGKYSAIAYTLIENCKRFGLNPEDYLERVIKALPPNANIEQAQQLTPEYMARSSHPRVTKSA